MNFEVNNILDSKVSENSVDELLDSSSSSSWSYLNSSSSDSESKDELKKLLREVDELSDELSDLSISDSDEEYLDEKNK